MDKQIQKKFECAKENECDKSVVPCAGCRHRNKCYACKHYSNCPVRTEDSLMIVPVCLFTAWRTERPLYPNAIAAFGKSKGKRIT